MTRCGSRAAKIAVMHNTIFNDVVGCNPPLEGAHETARVHHASGWLGGPRGRSRQAAQRPKVWRIGVLAAVPPMPAMLSAFGDGMRERGYVEGQNLSIDLRWPQGTFEHDPSPVAELINSNVDVIVAWPTPAANAARRATSAILIVMVAAADGG
jgi:ABC transporter substrate binding protein